MKRILCLIGTRPELIKLAPIVRLLEERRDLWQAVVVASSQHVELLHPLAEILGIRFDHDLGVMQRAQTPGQVVSAVVGALEPLLQAERPDLVVVQGDTATALGGALAAFDQGVAIAHVEAGLRSGDRRCPFPEEMYRRLISRMAALHLAPTPGNVENLRAEGVPAGRIVLSGNPVVDALRDVRARCPVGERIERLVRGFAGQRLLVLTTHRAENIGAPMRDYLGALCGFVEEHPDVALVCPVHLNPRVREIVRSALPPSARVALIEPLLYPDFLHLLRSAWIIVSDSGGILEEAASLGKQVCLLRARTERPEAVAAGYVPFIGIAGAALRAALDTLHARGAAVGEVGANPFGNGDSAGRILDAMAGFLGERERVASARSGDGQLPAGDR